MKPRARSSRLVGALLGGALAAAASAQSVVTPAATTPASATASTPGKDTAMPALSNVASALSAGLPLIKRGPIAVRPHLQYRYLSGNGVEAGPGNPQDTTIQSLSPGVLIEVGRHWKLDYTPTWTYYSSEAFRDTFDQTASLGGHYAGRNWSVGGSQIYEATHSMLIETGRQTYQEKHSTNLGGAYQIGPRTTLEGSVSRNMRYANAITAAPEWTTSDWLQYSSSDWVRYKVSGQLNVAAGVNFGWADVSAGDDMSFTQPQAQFAWQPTKKITLSAQGGIEYRTFHRGNRGTLRTPLYSAAVSWAPVPTTRLKFDATRIVSASYYANELSRSRGWSGGVEQRLLGRLFLDASYSTQHTAYLPVRDIGIVRRRDRYRAASFRLSTVFFKRGVIAAVYHVGRNTSDLREYEFVTHQVGFELSHRF